MTNKRTDKNEKPPVVFRVFGPYPIPGEWDGKAGVWEFPAAAAPSIFDSVEEPADELANDVGCYVFCIKHGHSYTPFYVGKTAKGFGQEVFATHKQEKCKETISLKKGTPMFFLLPIERNRGRIPKQAIDAMESKLIAMAYARNPDLLNVRKIPKDSSLIQGVGNGKRGCKPAAVKDFIGMMGQWNP